jgi:hypothetical protein
MVLRIVGTCALLFALGVLVAKYGWSLGFVMFSGHTTSTAALIYCALIALVKMRASPRHRPGRSAQAS